MIIKVYIKNDRGKWYCYQTIYSSNFEIHCHTLYHETGYVEYEKIKFYRLFNIVKVWEKSYTRHERSKA